MSNIATGLTPAPALPHKGAGSLRTALLGACIRLTGSENPHDRRLPRPCVRAVDRRQRPSHRRDPQALPPEGGHPYRRADVPLRDGARADTKALFRAGDEGWGGLADVDLRVGRFGRLEFTHDGEAYGIQYMPAGMQELVAPPELMLAQMMNAGVDHCVLQAGGGYGAMTEMNADSGRRYPGRMTGLMHVDEAMAGDRRSSRRSITPSPRSDCAASTSTSIR